MTVRVAIARSLRRRRDALVPQDTFDLVIAANRLPVDRVRQGGKSVWRRSPGGLVTAMESVMTSPCAP